MTPSTDLLLLAVIGLNLFVATSSRLRARIRACALQGIALAALPIAVDGANVLTDGPGLHVALAVIATLVLKAGAIPYALTRAMYRSGVRREVEPFVSMHISLLLTAGLVGLAFYIGGAVLPRLPGTSPLGIPAGLSTLLVGLYLAMSAKTALSQVIGYLILENGVFIIGQMLLGEFPLVVELGVLLDVLVAAMLMAVMVVSGQEVTEFADLEDSRPSLVDDTSGGAR
ncbi:MAG: hydrogenase [Myxococcota bacterium]|jgi:hydrogenase-4 component E|nr:hydrogenase [Myxococcota bacterium]HQL58189.1 hydrogenase [Myxococcota bacterium]